jgi:hypothetical protein
LFDWSASETERVWMLRGGTPVAVPIAPDLNDGNFTESLRETSTQEIRSLPLKPGRKAAPHGVRLRLASEEFVMDETRRSPWAISGLLVGFGASFSGAGHDAQSRP